MSGRFSRYLNNRRVVMFDLDGTLVDSMGGFANIAAEVISREYKLTFDDARREYLRTSGIPFFQQLDLLFPGKESNSRLAEEFENRKLEGFFGEDYFEDVPESISWLRSVGIKTVVSSNNFEDNVKNFVGKGNVVFDYILGFRHGFAKGKDHFKWIMSNEGIGPESMVFVGDSLKDGERALDEGVDFIGRTGTFNAEQFETSFPQCPIITSLRDLRKFLAP